MFSSQVSFENDTLKFSSGLSYKFEFTITELIEFCSMAIVRLEIPPKVINNENVYCISENGELKWQIEKTDHIYEDSPYTGMILKDDNLFVYNWDGLEAKINPQTGKIMSKKYGK